MTGFLFSKNMLHMHIVIATVFGYFGQRYCNIVFHQYWSGLTWHIIFFLRLLLHQIWWYCPFGSTQMTVALIQGMGRSTLHLAGGITHAGLLYPGTSPLTCSLPQHQTPVVQSLWTVTPDLVQVNTHTPKQLCSAVTTLTWTFWCNTAHLV